ncbi:exocyst complex component exo84, partial [Quaeritorhiza haematococci]
MKLKAKRIFASCNVEPPRITSLRHQIDDRVTRLSNLISLDLANPVSTKKSVQANIDRLLKLGLGEQARDIFLTARTLTIRHRIRQLKFDGDISNYISDLAQVVFRLIRNTSDWYGGSFRETYMASGFMKWVRGEIENYGNVFRRQVFDSKQNFEVIAKCLEHTMNQCKQLRDVGLDVSFVLDKLFFDDIVRAIDEHAQRCTERILKSFAKEKFLAIPPPPELSDRWEREFGDLRFRQGHSVYDFYTILVGFGEDMRLMMSISLYSKIVSCLKDFFTTYLRKLFEMLDRDWSNRQYLTMLVDAKFTVEDLMPKVAAQLASIWFDRPVPELEEHRIRLRETVQAMNSAYIRVTTAKMISKDYNFPTIDYSSSASILESAKPSDAITKLVSELHMVAIELDQSTLDKKATITDIIQRLFEFMTEGVQQLVLDIHFFLRVAEQYVSEKTNLAANAICERALRAYFSQNKDMRVALKTGE